MMNVTTVRRDGDDSGPLEIELSQDYDFAYQVREEREPAVIDSGTVTIRKGDTTYVDAEAVVPDSEGGFTYQFLAADAPTDPTEALIAEFALVSGTDDFSYREIFDIVRVPLRVPIAEHDLFSLFPHLRDMRRLGLEEGLALAASTDTTLVAQQLIGVVDGFYVGGELDIIDGTNVDLFRRVTAFDGSTGTATVDPAFPAALDATSRFRIRRSWQPIIAEAWTQMREKIRNRGNRPSLIMDGQAFRTSLLYVAAALAYQALALGNDDDPLMALSIEYDKQGWEKFDAMKFYYDATDGGNPTNEIKPQVTQMERL